MNGFVSETDIKPDAGPTTEFLDKVYPASVFGETFNRKQVAWIMAVFFLEEVLEKFWLSSKSNF